MISKLLNEEVQRFILENENKNPFELSLKYKEVGGVHIKEISEQIAARKKAKKKLPKWYSAKGVIFPQKISVEQSSSEITANYKASLISGNSFADVTGGMGVDTWALSSSFDKGYYVEQNQELAHLTEHNLKVLGIVNIDFKNTKAEDFLNHVNKRLDLIYIDPARRGDNKNKVFQLSECTPDVKALLPDLLEKGNKVLIKTAPLLDISKTLSDLPGVSEVHIVSVHNECKEVLYLVQKDEVQEPFIKTVNFLSAEERQNLEFKLSEEHGIAPKYGNLRRYLFEPNSSIMKAGAFKSIAKRFNLIKLHPNTHLYTGDERVTGFPGRAFSVKAYSKYGKKEVRKILNGAKANVATRNFPDEPEKVKKKLGLKDGGNVYLFGCRLHDDSLAIVKCEKL